MDELSCELSPLVYGHLYRLLDENEEYRNSLAEPLKQVGLPEDWLAEAAEAYSGKWEHDLTYLDVDNLDTFKLSTQHAELATWVLSQLRFQGASAELSADLQEAVIEQALHDVPGLQHPPPSSLRPVIIAWTLGRDVSPHGAQHPSVPAVLPANENAREAFVGLVEHLLTLQQLSEPLPELMCSSLYWRGYGIAEALRPEQGSGGAALVQLNREAYKTLTGELGKQISNHLTTFAERRNALSHVADMMGRPRFTDTVRIARDPKDLELTARAVTHFVFQDVCQQVQIERPAAVRRGAWERLEMDLDTSW